MEKAKRYKGIDYVRLSVLPKEEQNQIMNWLNSDTKIKIQTEAELMDDCILFKDYAHWYNSVYTKISLVEEEKVERKYKNTKQKLFGWGFNQS